MSEDKEPKEPTLHELNRQAWAMESRRRAERAQAGQVAIDAVRAAFGGGARREQKTLRPVELPLQQKAG